MLPDPARRVSPFVRRVAALLVLVSASLISTACRNATEPRSSHPRNETLGPGCVLSVPIVVLGMPGNINAYYGDCPAPEFVSEWVYHAPDGSSETFNVTWDVRVK